MGGLPVPLEGVVDPMIDLRALLEKATPGPWTHTTADEISAATVTAEDDTSLDHPTILVAVCWANDRDADPDGLHAGKSDPDAALIVAAVNALPALLDVLDAARATGWNEADGKCWCPESREVTKAPQHEPRCAALRDALRRLDEGEPR